MTPAEARARRTELLGTASLPGSGQADFRRRYLENDPAAVAEIDNLNAIIAAEVDAFREVTQPAINLSPDPTLAAAVAGARADKARLLADGEFMKRYHAGEEAAVAELDRVVERLGEARGLGVV